MNDWLWVAENGAMISMLTLQHLQMVLLSLTAGTLLTLFMLTLTVFFPAISAPLAGASGVLFTIPSLALFIFLLPWTGLSMTTAVTGLTIYSLLILMRNVLAGLQNLPADILESARAMGYSRFQCFIQIEIILLLPAYFAGLRIAAVTLTGLVVVTALIGQGGLGQLMLQGFSQNFLPPVVTSLILTVVLSLSLDLLISKTGHYFTRWARK